MAQKKIWKSHFELELRKVNYSWILYYYTKCFYLTNSCLTIFKQLLYFFIFSVKWKIQCLCPFTGHLATNLDNKIKLCSLVDYLFIFSFPLIDSVFFPLLPLDDSLLLVGFLLAFPFVDFMPCWQRPFPLLVSLLCLRPFPLVDSLPRLLVSSGTWDTDRKKKKRATNVIYWPTGTGVVRACAWKQQQSYTKT